MIIGKLKDIKRYKGISENIDVAIDYILNNDLLALPKGKHIISPEVFINRDTYIARPLSECFFENHENYLDLQIVLKGKEMLGYTDISNETLKISVPYDSAKDVTKYTCENGLYFVLEEGFALVFKEDIHLAKGQVNDEIVEKAVIKIKV